MSEAEVSGPVTLRVAPAKNGWNWLAEGLRYFRASPGMWTLLMLAYWMLIAVMNGIGPLGAVVVAVCLPAFSASFSIVCDEIRRGQAVRPLILVQLVIQATLAQQVLLVLPVQVVVTPNGGNAT